MPVRASLPVSKAVRNTHSYLSDRHSRSMKMLSIQRPRPSMEMRMPASLKGVGKSEAGELRALIGVEDAGLAVADNGLFQCRNAEVGIHRIRQSPGQDLAAGPVHDRNQVEEAAPHRDVGHVGAPHMVRLIDSQMPKQIRIDFVSRVRLTGLRMLIDRRQTHLGHQPADAMTTNAPAVATQMPDHLTRTVPRCLQELLVDQTHQSERCRALHRRLTVERRAADRCQLALAYDREPWMIGFDHCLPPIQAQRSKALAKKSRSTTS